MNTKIILLLFIMLSTFHTHAQGPYSMEDGSLIGIKGTVASVGHQSFVLDYGDGNITVRLEDDELAGDEHKFIENEEVTVFGMVDEKFFRSTSIKARAVFVESLSSFVHTTDGFDRYVGVVTPAITSGSVVFGKVTGISGNNIMLDQGDRRITIDTTPLGYDPMQAEGDQRVREGDLVTAVGNMDQRFWTGHTLRATSLEVIREVDNEERKAGTDRHPDEDH